MRLATKAVDELDAAQIAAAVAREAVAEGVTDIARGAEAIGAGEATEAMGKVLEERAA